MYQLMTEDDHKTYLLYEPIDTTLYQDYDPTTPIEVTANDLTMVRLVALDSNNCVVAEGRKTFRNT